MSVDQLTRSAGQQLLLVHLLQLSCHEMDTNRAQPTQLCSINLGGKLVLLASKQRTMIIIKYKIVRDENGEKRCALSATPTYKNCSMKMSKDRNTKDVN